jgi:hypothetical protein
MPGPLAWDALLQTYPQASPSVRVAILRASATIRTPAASALRARARGAADPRLAATALLASWLAGDALGAVELELRDDTVWPLGPLSAFLAADPALTSTPEREARLCAALDRSEPSTRANAFAALAARGAACARARAPAWLLGSRVWPIRLTAARALLAGPPGPVPDTTAAQDRTRAACRRDPEPRVRQLCGASAPAEAEPALPPRADAGTSFQALVLQDGRVVISARDGAGDASWPQLRHIVAENPWRWAYAAE